MSARPIQLSIGQGDDAFLQHFTLEDLSATVAAESSARNRWQTKLSYCQREVEWFMPTIRCPIIIQFRITAGTWPVLINHDAAYTHLDATLDLPADNQRPPDLAVDDQLLTRSPALPASRQQISSHERRPAVVNVTKLVARVRNSLRAATLSGHELQNHSTRFRR